MKIGEEIRTLRKENKITQEKLAYEIGVSRQIVGEWERGERTPTLVNANALATFFHVSVDVFFERSVENVIKNDSDKKTKRKKSKLLILCLICSCISGAILLFALCIFIIIFLLFIKNRDSGGYIILYDNKLMYSLICSLFVFITFIVSIYFLHKETKKEKNKQNMIKEK